SLFASERKNSFIIDTFYTRIMPQLVEDTVLVGDTAAFQKTCHLKLVHRVPGNNRKDGLIIIWDLAEEGPGAEHINGDGTQLFHCVLNRVWGSDPNIRFSRGTDWGVDIHPVIADLLKDLGKVINRILTVVNA